MNIIYHFRVKGVGPERVHISGIAGALKKLGHNITFVSPTDINPLEAGDIKPAKGMSRGILYFFADKIPQAFFELMEISYNLMAMKKLRKRLSETRIDLIYERYAFFCCAGVYLAKKRGIPIVLEVNEVSGFERVRPQCFVWLLKKFEQYVFSNASAIVTVSEFLKHQVEIRGGNPEDIIVIPNGIDTELFSKQIDSSDTRNKLKTGDKTIIGFIGYLVHWHRLDVLIDVFARIHAKYPNTLLLLVGDGVLRNDLENLAKEKGIEDALIVTGRVDHSEIPKYIDILDIAMIPNSNMYRSPIKMFEYMAMGKPIIAPDQQPILAVIQDNVTGLIFKNGDADDLLAKIEAALNSKEKCRDIGAKAKRLVEEKYTWDLHAETILAFLNKREGVGSVRQS
jgi:glycosyltransferase involved in cell wall biosynthesis